MSKQVIEYLGEVFIRKGKKFRILNIIDENTREYLSCYVARRITSKEVIECLGEVFLRKDMLEYLLADNGSEFITKRVREFLGLLRLNLTYITPGSPWENGYLEAFNSRMRAEFLNRELFDTLLEAKGLIEQW